MARKAGPRRSGARSHRRQPARKKAAVRRRRAKPVPRAARRARAAPQPKARRKMPATRKARRRGMKPTRRARAPRTSTGKTATRPPRTPSTKSARTPVRAVPDRSVAARPARRPARRPRVPPSLLRERRTLHEDEPRDLGAALTGQEELVEKLLEHTETGPTLTGGDLDGNWELAYSSGDEAPGGDNPTPDQADVGQIGRALGIHYADDEELTLGDKEIERDRHRWELDPASAEDYSVRSEEE